MMQSKFGINAISFYVPNLYVSMDEIGKARNIAPEKLKKGLGLNKMAIPNTGEDAVTFAANALLNLILQNNITPQDIGRIYLGTESAVDGSKPTATYAMEIVETILSNTFGDRCFKNCDALDMTFACIGGVDALHNSIDWIKQNPNKLAVVIASDLSKYDIASTGEYTQGAGAVAVSIAKNPDILSIDDTWGVATKSEGDFFKPRRIYKKKEVIKDLLNDLKIDTSDSQIQDFLASTSSNFWSDPSEIIEIFKEEPVFDGQFSNNCYNDRVIEALTHFKAQKSQLDFVNDWQQLIFHLPYAFHGRRIIFDSWLNWIEKTPFLDLLENEIGKQEKQSRDWNKLAYKSELYNQFVKNKIEAGERASSEIGNMYTASIFMSFLSYLSVNANESCDITGDTVGFIAYGSGSKSKIFQGVIQPNWKTKISQVKLFDLLENRNEIKIDQYEDLHTAKKEEPILNGSKISLDFIETSITNYGLRRYIVN